ncbi:MAG: signal peptidase II [Verrucomicrobia bacterium]|nr:signal peptidase II [Verrucomicrobiota bacterium]
MTWTPNKRMAAIALGILALDQITKQLVVHYLEWNGLGVVVFDGFFKLVHWGNTGAAWSMFSGQNAMLAIISLLALLGLFIWRHHFDCKTVPGQISLGLIFGGIAGNLIDRLFIGHVVDFIRFYIYTRSGQEAGFPAFNVADSAICVGVGLLFIQSWRAETQKTEQETPAATK